MKKRQFTIQKIETPPHVPVTGAGLPTYPNLFSEYLTTSNSSAVSQTISQPLATTNLPESVNAGESSTEAVEEAGTIEAKRRGRKPKVKTEEELMAEKIPKKRGRKPKEKTEIIQIIKKRGRKPKDKDKFYSLVSAPAIVTSDTTISQPPAQQSNIFPVASYIVNLKLNSSDLERIIKLCGLKPIDIAMSKQHTQPTGNTYEPNFNLYEGASATSANNTNNNTNANTNNLNINSNSYSKSDQANSGLTNELVNYLENHFNEIYSSSYKIKDINRVVMPRIRCEDANFDFGNKLQTSTASLSSGLNLSKFKQINSNINGVWSSRKISELLPAFRNKTGKWPQSSPYACWNCSEHFDCAPFGIPDNIEGDVDSLNADKLVFYLYGNFCTPGCAARYLFDTEAPTAVWEKYSMLNVLHCLMYDLKQISKVELAPEKFFLNKFGGYMNIEQYRSANQGGNKFQIFKPPMIPILPQMEESADDTMRESNQFIPLDHDVVNNVEKKIRLKRLAPVKGGALTIDRCMHFNFKRTF